MNSSQHWEGTRNGSKSRSKGRMRGHRDRLQTGHDGHGIDGKDRRGVEEIPNMKINLGVRHAALLFQLCSYCRVPARSQRYNTVNAVGSRREREAQLSATRIVTGARGGTDRPPVRGSATAAATSTNTPWRSRRGPAGARSCPSWSLFRRAARRTGRRVTDMPPTATDLGRVRMRITCMRPPRLCAA